MHDKAFYEAQIDQTSFFRIDPEKDPILYEREKNRLLEYLFLYKTAESPANGNYSLEIVEVFKDCLKYYHPEEGRFLNYFNAAFSKRSRIVKAQEQIEGQSSGIHFSRREKSAFARINHFLKKHPEMEPDKILTLLDDFTEELGLNMEETREAILVYRNSLSDSGNAILSHSEDFSMSLFDTLYSSYDFTEEIDTKESVRQWLDRCEEEYLKARKGTRELLAMKLTSLLTVWDRNGEFTEEIRKKAFFHEETYEYVSRTGKKISNVKLGELLNKSGPNITQIWNRFMEKLKG